MCPKLVTDNFIFSIADIEIETLMIVANTFFPFVSKDTEMVQMSSA